MRQRVAGSIVLVALVSAVAGLYSQSPSPTTIAIVGATLIDGRGGAPVPDTTVIVADGKIDGDRIGVQRATADRRDGH